MNIYIFVFLLSALQILCLYVGKIYSRKLQNKEDYFFAGRSVRFFPLMMTFVATQVGGGTILGAAEEAYLYGWSVLFYPVGVALGLMILGCGVGRKLASFQVPTVAQIFDVVYRSPILRIFASILSIVSLFLVLIAVMVASHKFLASLGLVNRPLILFFWGIVLFYTVRGGLKAVIATDVVQAVFFLAVFLGCFFYCAPTLAGQIHFDDSIWIPEKISGWLIMPLLFMLIEQDMAQRCFAGSSPRVVSKAAFGSGLVTLALCLVPIVFGVAARSIGLQVPAGSSVFMAFVAHATNPWIASLVGCAVLAVILSTADSLINAISSNLSSDFAWFQKRESIRLVQIMTGMLSIAAMAASFYFDRVVGLMIFSYELSVSCLFVPIAAALFKKEGNFISAWLGVVGGIAGYILIPTFALFFSAAGFVFGEGFAWVRKKYNLDRILPNP